MNKEIWKKVPGFNGIYEVSNLGNLRSWYILGGTTRFADSPSPIKAHDTGRALQAHLWDRSLKKYRNITISRLVASLFVGAPKRGEVIWLKDRNHRNCAASNLEWVTTKDRSALSIMLGEQPKTRGALTDRQVVDLIAERRSGAKLNDLSAKYGIHFTTVCQAATGWNYKHVHAALAS